MTDSPSLHLDNIGHRFRDDQPWLFRDVSASVLAGERVALIGPSGSGKSTLLGLIAGWIAPAAGTVELAGIERTQWVFQNPHGVAHRDALDHVVLPMLVGGFTRADAEQEAVDLLASLHLEHLVDRRPFSRLSGGEAQRLMFARAIASRPQLMLVDEPTAQLDRASAQAVNEAVQRLSDGGAIVIVATHDDDTAAACDRVINLADYRDRPLGGEHANWSADQ